MEILPLMYEFLKWRECFDKLRELVTTLGKENIRFVVSEHEFTSGYWIENANKPFQNSYGLDFAYTVDEAFKLEKLIIEEHQRAQLEKRGITYIRLEPPLGNKPHYPICTDPESLDNTVGI